MEYTHNRYVSKEKLLVVTHLPHSKLKLITVYSHCDLPLGFQLAILNAFWFL